MEKKYKTPKEVILENYQSHTVEQLAQRCMFPISHIKKLCKQLGVSPKVDHVVVVQNKKPPVPQIQKRPPVQQFSKEVLLQRSRESTILKNYKLHSINELAEMCHVKPNYIIVTCARLGVRPMMKEELLIDQAREIILKNYKRYTIRELFKMCDISKQALKGLIAELAVEPVTEEDRFNSRLLDLYEKHSIPELAIMLCQTEQNLKIRANQLGISLKELPQAPKKRRELTEEEKEYLRGPAGEMIQVLYDGLLQYEREVERPGKNQQPVYTQSGSPYGLADELRGIKTNRQV